MITQEYIKNLSPLIVRVELADTFHCSHEDYYKIRRKELKRKAKSSAGWRSINIFYPYSKPLMEKLWGWKS